MLKTYDGISVGTIQRRRRAPVDRFLNLVVTLPSFEDQQVFNKITNVLQTQIGLLKSIASQSFNLVSYLSDIWLSMSDKNGPRS